MALQPMPVSAKSISSGSEILYNSAYLGDALTLDDSAFSNGLCLAGTPITIDGKIASGADAFGILLSDVTQASPQATAVIGGYISASRAEAHSGVKISDAVKNALKNVAFL